jgi:eukaryotic-like serine/threonine-protein kinase
MVNDTTAPHLGMLIDGRYQVDSLLGKGGMGVVYRASHVGLRRQVAVKVLHASLAANLDVRNRFEREALAIGKIDHLNCVGVYDVGQLPDGSLYLAMEFLEGKTLGALIDIEQQLPVPRVLHIVRHILNGLEHVHGAGLVHRDIKPENIFLVTNGDDHDFAKILDFGIAKPVLPEVVDDGVKLTQAGMAFGTPIYMAPEQALGNPLDGRADLYALSVMAFEMLTGNPPFFSEDKLEVMSAHTARPIPIMAERLIPNGHPVPANIERVIAKGLAKRPSDRYANAAEYIEAINSIDRAITEGIFDQLDDDIGGVQPVGDGQRPLTSAISDTGSLKVLTAEPSSPNFGQLAQSLGAWAATTPEAQGEKTAVTRAGGHGTRLATPPPLAAHRVSEPVLLTKRKLSSLRKWAFIAVVATSIGAGVAWFALRNKEIEPSGAARDAIAALDAGDANRAIKIIQNSGPTLNDNSELMLLLGHARSAKRESEAALEAYKRALSLAPAVAADTTLRANLKAMVDDKNPDIAGKALEIAIAKTQIADAERWMIEMAVSDSVERRKVARDVGEFHKLLSKVDLMASYALDLDQESSCEKRRDVVSKLRALGDIRAIAALERSKSKLGSNGKQKGKPINQCLQEDAAAALSYLRGLPGAPPAPAPIPTTTPRK